MHRAVRGGCSTASNIELTTPTQDHSTCRSNSRLPTVNVLADDPEIVAGGFEGMLGVAVRDESRVVVEGDIPLPPETVEHGEQASMFPVNARPHEFDDCDVMPRLASGPEPVAEHEPQGRLEHRFVGWLETGFLIERKDLLGRGELFLGAHEEAVNLRPVNCVGPEFFHPQQ